MAFDTDCFKTAESNYYFTLLNPSVLQFSQTGSYPYVYGKFDFLVRVLYTGYDTDGGVQTTPFSQLDRDVIVAMRNKLIALGGKPAPLADADNEEWIRIGNTGIAQATTSAALGHKLTNVFNFVNRQMTTLTENLSTRAETGSTPVSFDDLPDTALAEALAKFTELGGKTDETFVLKGKASLPKNKLGSN